MISQEEFLQMRELRRRTATILQEIDVFLLRYSEAMESDDPGIARIQRLVAASFECTIKDIRSQRRDRQIVLARDMAMYLAREMTHHSFPTIGRAFGDRDHSTVMSAVKRAERRVKTDNVSASRAQTLRQKIELSREREETRA